MVTVHCARLQVFDEQLIDQILAAADCKQHSPRKDTIPDLGVTWNSLGEKKAVRMFYGFVEGNGNHFFKGLFCLLSFTSTLFVAGVTELPFSVDDVESQIRVIDNMRIIDPMCLTTEIIKTFDRDHHFYYASFRLGPMIWNRDFVWFCLDTRLPDGYCVCVSTLLLVCVHILLLVFSTYISTGKSIITPLCPPRSGTVRGEIRASGYVVEVLLCFQRLTLLMVAADS